ncbi:type II toxin-antitoxin system HipA family toxin [Nisaea sediminum]|uniref:type II toxin-antitoxin system HipA family toxin n=1 Tax=Nisaea sediminum TaxID=2775867 RepID=UPI0018685233|nr:type II toxin-antitoxin system HipA family toxin [Nisaea sediminum]
MTSDPHDRGTAGNRRRRGNPPEERGAYVWAWLPRQPSPVVAGRVVLQGGRYSFAYGRSYRERPNAIPLYLPELPIAEFLIDPPDGMDMAGCLRDALPDAWGRRVILNRIAVREARDTGQLDEVTYMLESGSDRIGALDFQRSATDFVGRDPENASLEELLTAADRIERDIPLTPGLERALLHGSSIGGARPKAGIEDTQNKYVAKFSASNDTYAVVKAEFIAMRLARLAGLGVADVRLETALGKDVLLVRRFDRERLEEEGGARWARRMMVSGLTILGLDEMMARYASYQQLTDIVRLRFAEPKRTLRELFGRLVFNVLVGNTDDHARNHAAFWDGRMLNLTPAYDICPQPRTGREASQAMTILDIRRESRLELCLEAAPKFLLDREQAIAIVRDQIAAIVENWREICSAAGLEEAGRRFFWRRQFLNPSIFYGTEDLFAPELDVLERA